MIKTLQWLNENRRRTYPLQEDVIAQLVGGSVVYDIPTDLFLDFQLVSYDLEPDAVKLTLLTIVVGTPKLARFTFTVDSSSFVLEVPISNPVIPYTARLLSGHTRLQVVFGEALTEWLDTLTAGDYTPVADAAHTLYLEPALCSFQPRHRVESITGTYAGSVPLTGVIYISDGYNVKADFDVAAKTVQFSAIPGIGLGRSPVRVDPSRPGCGDVLLLINEVAADGAGNFRIVGGQGVGISTSPDGTELQALVATQDADIDCGK